MRVVVAAGPYAGLSSAQTGTALARAWAELGCTCAVVPIAEAGRGFADAWSDLGAGGSVLPLGVDGGDDVGSVAAGELVADALGHLEADLLLEHGGRVHWRDGGAGLLAALGATADVPLDRGTDGLAGISRLDLTAARERLQGRTLRLVTTREQAALPLVGLRGITSLARDEPGWTPERLLAADQALVDLATAAGVPGTAPGTGAAGGLGLAVLALGGEVAAGPDLLAGAAGLPDTARRADLVVSGCDQLDFGTKGGDLLPAVTEVGQAAMRPVVALARRNFISAREVRTMGIEEAYGLAREERPLSMTEVTELARPAARTWQWGARH